MKAIAAVAILASSLTAQWVVPQTGSVFDRNAESDVPFGFDHFRFQQIWEGSAIAPTAATITGLAWRRDTTDNTPFGPGPNHTVLDVRMGYASGPPGLMAQAFAQNPSGTPTLVASGPFNLPGQPAVPSIAVFSVQLPFATPFSFAASGNYLLLELESAGRASGRVRYTLDAEYLDTDGRITMYGSAGAFANGVLPRMSYDASVTPLSTVVPGGSVLLRVANVAGAYPTLLLAGLSTISANGLPLPFDLSVFGAGGNTLLTAVDASLGPVTAVPGRSRYQADFHVPIPNIPGLPGAVWFNQGVCLEPAANPLGAVFSDAAAVVIGGNPAPPYTQILVSNDSTNANGLLGLTTTSLGSVWGPRNAGGLVTEFHGTRQ